MTSTQQQNIIRQVLSPCRYNFFQELFTKQKINKLATLIKIILMKKLNLLMLLALTLLMFGCRTELSNDIENNATQSDFRKTIKLKEALAFKNYLTEIKNNPSNFYSKNEDFFSSLSDDATVTVITQNNVTSYSTVVRHLERSSDVLVYSVDNENKSIGFTAKYKPADLTKNIRLIISQELLNTPLWTVDQWELNNSRMARHFLIKQ